jgi:hypothetical protein
VSSAPGGDDVGDSSAGGDVGDSPGGDDVGDSPRGGGGSDSPEEGAADRPQLQRLDPDRAAVPRSPAASPAASPAVTEPPAPSPAHSAPVIDTRRYRWAIGIFGLIVVVVVSVIQFATHGVGTTGILPGHRLRYFAAPLASTNLNGDPNLRPPCTVARHDPRALNICLLAAHGPLVLSFFVTGSGSCERQVDALQTLSQRYRSVQFAAVAIDAGHAATASLVRSHHWTIPVAYDQGGFVGQLYGIAVCPMVELADRGGIVKYRLIDDRYQTAAALAPYVRALAAAGTR